ncbi:MAG TPA: hypothetical protein VF258_10920, partial [Luteolibacter sp.]
SVKELTGGLVSKGGAGAMAADVRALLDDPQLAARCSQAGLTQWHASYEPSVVYQQWESLLLSAVARPS